MHASTDYVWFRKSMMPQRSNDRHAGGWCGGQPIDMHKNWQTIKTLPLHVKAIVSKHKILYEEQYMPRNTLQRILRHTLLWWKLASTRDASGWDERASPYWGAEFSVLKCKSGHLLNRYHHHAFNKMPELLSH